MAFSPILLSLKTSLCITLLPRTPIIPYIYGCQTFIDVNTMLWVQLQAEGRMQSNTDKSCDSLHRSSEYLEKLQPRTSLRRTRWLLGHQSKEICALHSQQWRHIQLVQKRPYISTVSFNKTSSGPLHLVQVLALPPDNIIRRLSKPEFYLWTTITIRVEMTPLITESRSDYQHTGILTHSNSTTITIRQQTPDFVLQQPRKNCYCRFYRMRMFSDTAVLVGIPSEWENVSIIEYDHVSPLKKEPASCSRWTESGKPWERERNWKGGDAVWVVRVLFMLSQRFCANGIMLQIFII